MTRGTDFEVSKEVYERAKANTVDDGRKEYYMAPSDEEKLFSESIRYGYGLYSCMVREEDGKYICTWKRGSSCD
mgnify:CR=1 FL=1